MTHQLDGAFAKIARAEHHIQELQAEISRTSGYTDSIRFAQTFVADTSTVEITLEGVPDLPIEWSLIAADYVQNLRCALNYLAWELSRWNLHRQGLTREPNPKTQFPINTRPRQFDDWRLPDVHPDHIAHIKALQPNEANFLSQLPETTLRDLDVPTLAQNHILGILVELTNEDKHRVLPGLLTVARESHLSNSTAVNCTITTRTYFVQRRGLQNGAKWAEFKVATTGGMPEVHVHDKIFAVVEFGRHDISETLPEVGAGVRALIAGFESIF